MEKTLKGFAILDLTWQAGGRPRIKGAILILFRHLSNTMAMTRTIITTIIFTTTYTIITAIFTIAVNFTAIISMVTAAVTITTTIIPVPSSLQTALQYHKEWAVASFCPCCLWPFSV